MKYVPTHAKAWTRPNNYCGDTFEGTYRGLAVTRDSDVLQQSNFESMLEKLGGEGRGVIVTHSSHWACGWVKEILVKKTANKKLELLDQMLKKYDDYPVIDEIDFSERECQYQDETFEFYKEEFRTEALKVANLDENDHDLIQLDDFIRDVYLDDGSYRGIEDAFVTVGSIKRYLESYEGKRMARTNYYAAACKMTLKKTA